MKNDFRDGIIRELQNRYGRIQHVGAGHSLFYVQSADFYVYFRYSKLTGKGKATQKTFYGLRKEDLDLMQTKNSFICFLTDNNDKNIVLPFRQFESYFSSILPVSDGQYKTALFFKPTGVELYINNVGKFNVENHLGIGGLFDFENRKLVIPLLTHSQVQSLIGSIGIGKGYEVWFPKNDKLKIDDSIVNFSKVRETLPLYGREIDHIISEIDVIWLNNTAPVSFYEIEHSTPIYSGLLRFNDVLLTVPNAENFNIIADNDRENKFGREVNRPTFKQNRLIDKVVFIDYTNVCHWYYSLFHKEYHPRLEKQHDHSR